MRSDISGQPQLSETTRSTLTVESPHAQGCAFSRAALLWSKVELQRPGHLCSTRETVMGSTYSKSPLGLAKALLDLHCGQILPLSSHTCSLFP